VTHSKKIKIKKLLVHVFVQLSDNNYCINHNQILQAIKTTKVCLWVIQIRHLEQESLANAKVNARQHCVSLSCLCNNLTQIEWVADLSQHLG